MDNISKTKLIEILGQRKADEYQHLLNERMMTSGFGPVDDDHVEFRNNRIEQLRKEIESAFSN